MEMYLACIFSDVQKCGRLNIHLTFGGKLDKIIYLGGGGQYLCELWEAAEGNATSWIQSKPKIRNRSETSPTCLCFRGWSGKVLVLGTPKPERAAPTKRWCVLLAWLLSGSPEKQALWIPNLLRTLLTRGSSEKPLFPEITHIWPVELWICQGITLLMTLEPSWSSYLSRPHLNTAVFETKPSTHEPFGGRLQTIAGTPFKEC